LPENPASYRVVRKKSYLFNKAPLTIPETQFHQALSILSNVLNIHASQAATASASA